MVEVFLHLFKLQAKCEVACAVRASSNRVILMALREASGYLGWE